MNIDIYGLLDMPIGDFLGSSVSVLGIKGSGKSNTAAVLMEECLDANVPILVIDVTGEYHTITEMYPDVAVIGHSRDPARRVDIEVNAVNVQDIATAASKAASQVIFDLSGIARETRDSLLNDYLSVVWDMSASLRYPLVVFLEEAHNFIPQRKATECKETLIDIAAEGRKWGLSLVTIGQRSSRIEKDVVTQADISFLHHVTHPTDLKVYSEMIPRSRRWVHDKISKLNVGQALVLNGQNITSHQIRLRKTRHVGYTPGLDRLPNRRVSLVDAVARKYD